MTNELEYNGYPTGAMLAVIDGQGRLLAVRRPGTDDWSLPGGKREAGETAADNAVRECLEETGLSFNAVDVVPVHSALCEADSVSGRPYWVSCFATPLSVGAGEAIARETGCDVAWLTEAELLLKAAFPRYLRETLWYLNGRFLHKKPCTEESLAV